MQSVCLSPVSHFSTRGLLAQQAEIQEFPVLSSPEWPLSLLLSLSALDAENEFLVQEALERLMQGRTVLIIAHRLSTIQNADAVAVLDQQRVVECGRHAELLGNRHGLFRKLVEKQAFLQAKRKQVVCE